MKSSHMIRTVPIQSQEAMYRVFFFFFLVNIPLRYSNFAVNKVKLVDKVSLGYR